MTNYELDTIKAYINARKSYDRAEAAKAEAYIRLDKTFDGTKLPLKIVVGTNYIVVARNEGRIKVHINEIDMIYGAS